MTLDRQTLDQAQIIVVGSGCFGATIAERAASQLGVKVCVIEKRPHIGGNSYSEICPQTGIECHRYGSHIFHTNNQAIWSYINGFSKFTSYRHHVWTIYQGGVYAMPINLGTICAFLRQYLTPDQARAWVAEQIAQEPCATARNLEEKAISLIGRPLYQAFIENYTRKQWQADPKTLPSSIITRLPVRYNFNSRYFSDKYEGMPENGYTHIFEKMLNNKNISVYTNIDWFDIGYQPASHQLLIYTGPIDRYFDFCYGELGWRTVTFEREVHNIGDYQGCPVMNYADAAVPFTRIHEFRHFYPDRAYPSDKTVIFKEFSAPAGQKDEPYYPIGTDEDKKKFDLYWGKTLNIRNLIFAGRLGRYQYLDMDQAICAALKTFSTTVTQLLANSR